MSTHNRWLLPEGIEELPPGKAARLERIRRAIVDLYSAWGYELVEPPFIEFLESLLTGTGEDLELQTFKVTDQMTGRLMGIRADMTPQVARMESRRLRREGISRLCYMGTVVHTRADGFAGSRTPFQIGAEIYGHKGTESDVEALWLMLETLKMTGIREYHVDLGHVGIFRSLAHAAGLEGEREQLLFDILQRKSRPELDSLLTDLSFDARQQTMLASLINLNGGPEILPEARKVLKKAGEETAAALDTLEALYKAISERVPDLSVGFDLAELRGYNYHTGAVFAAFLPGHGQEIALGGRYDAIGEVFGRARPATGFSTDLMTLATLAETSDEGLSSGVLAPWDNDPELNRLVQELRAGGERVLFELPGRSGPINGLNCNRRVVKRDNAWSVETIKVEKE